MTGKAPTLCLIAAVAENGVIGKAGELPWRIGSELRHFRKTTMGKPVIFGRRTFEGFGGKPLPGRLNIVVTRDPSFAVEGVITASSLEAAIGIASANAQETGADEIFVCGGADIYRQALPLADRFYLTEVHCAPEGDALFPAFNRAAWIEKSSVTMPPAAGETAGYTLKVLERPKTQ